VTEAAPFRQVLQNLIANAVKHHDRDRGTIRISADTDGAFVRFSIEDDGPGIPDRYRERIFKMFEKLAPKDEVEGSGIGLALVKKLVERKGGRIDIAAAGQGGRGAVFSFDWPKSDRRAVGR
jgi:signal transduction histidine kinase